MRSPAAGAWQDEDGAVQEEIELPASVQALQTSNGFEGVTVVEDGSTELVYVVGYRTARHAEAKVWAESARTQLSLLAAAPPLAEADLDNNLAGVHTMSPPASATSPSCARPPAPSTRPRRC